MDAEIKLLTPVSAPSTRVADSVNASSTDLHFSQHLGISYLESKPGGDPALEPIPQDEVNGMYYCIVCSNIHYQKHARGKVFKKGVYIEPGTGARIPFGMCGKCAGKEGEYPENRMMQPNHDTSSLANVNTWLPIYDYFAESHRTGSLNQV